MLTIQTTDFGDQIKARRKAIGLSQDELAHECKITQSMVSRFEAGQEPEMPTLRKLAKALACRIVIHPMGL